MLSGLVDTDSYRSPVNFPFVAVAPDGVYTLKKGTPLVQVIPFRRADVALEASIRAESPQEGEEREHIRRNTSVRRGVVQAPRTGRSLAASAPPQGTPAAKAIE